MSNPLALKNVKNMALPTAGAVGGIMAAKFLPNVAGFSEPSWARTGSQAALGAIALTLGKKNEALQFAGIALLSVALVEVLGRYVLPPQYAVSGIGAEYPEVTTPQYGAYPNEETNEPALEAGDNVGAYPFSEFPGEIGDRYAAGVTY